MKKILYILILLWAVTLTANAQTVLTGTITDAATGEPLITAQVYVKSGKKAEGTVTGLDGDFRLETKESLPLTLSVDYIGYRTQEIDVYACPGIALPVSFTPALRLKEDSSKSPSVPKTTTMTAKQVHAHIGR